jgi:steroid 5-alpha reductase family enzyme/predicted DCC family thiol-disulfide oxidoreductase YuxK
MKPLLFLIPALLLLAYAVIGLCIALKKNRMDVADIGWGGGFLIVTWSAFIISGFSWPALLVNLCVSLWALRLTLHIYQRNRHLAEDFRYETFKKRGDTKLWSFLKNFLVQSVILYVVALPLLWVHAYAKEISWQVLGGSLSLWAIGFFIEALSDYQLARFRKNPKNHGALLQTGLWSYSRHPNYLGEIIQWWALWSLVLWLPFGWALAVSPLLLTYLIIKVTGIAPLEKKMASHPEFQKYKEKTAVLAPISWLNGAIYNISWCIILFYGAKQSILLPLLAFLISYLLQLFLLKKTDQKLFLVSMPLSIYALFFGFLQETLFMHIPILTHQGSEIFPPIWLLTLYPLFSFSLNSTLFFLNRNLVLAFFLAGTSAVFSYYTIQKCGAIALIGPLSYPVLFVSWGLFMVVLVWLNRKLLHLIETLTKSEGPLTVFFDGNCPVCSREMKALQKRKQTGEVNYVSLTSAKDLEPFDTGISYSDAMRKIHAVDSNGRVLTGVHVLAALYARTDLPLLAVFLEAPLFHALFSIAYGVWAKMRRIIF